LKIASDILRLFERSAKDVVYGTITLAFKFRNGECESYSITTAETFITNRTEDYFTMYGTHIHDKKVIDDPLYVDESIIPVLLNSPKKRKPKWAINFRSVEKTPQKVLDKFDELTQRIVSGGATLSVVLYGHEPSKYVIGRDPDSRFNTSPICDTDDLYRKLDWRTEFEGARFTTYINVE